MTTRGSVKFALAAAMLAGCLSQPLAAAPARSIQAGTLRPVSPIHTMNGQQLRARHPVGQGGTTGGAVNPAINGNHKASGYNGG